MKDLTEMLGIYAKAEEFGNKKIRYFGRMGPSLALPVESSLSASTKEQKSMQTAGFIPFHGKKPAGSEEEKKAEEKEDIGFAFDPSQASEEDRLYLQKTKEFNERIRKDPKNVQVWMEYIRYQDVLVQSKYEKQVW